MNNRVQLLRNVLISPVTTEKTTQIGDKENTIAFWVQCHATKLQIKQAIQTFFKGVEVERVSTLLKRRDFVKFGNSSGRRKKQKKAYIKLKPGHEVNFTELNSEQR